MSDQPIEAAAADTRLRLYLDARVTSSPSPRLRMTDVEATSEETLFVDAGPPEVELRKVFGEGLSRRALAVALVESLRRMFERMGPTAAWLPEDTEVLEELHRLAIHARGLERLLEETAGALEPERIKHPHPEGKE